MQGLGKLIAVGGTIIAVISGLTIAGYLFEMLAVFNQGMAAASNGGDITPYIEALVLIMVAAVIPGWLIALTGVDLEV